MFFMGEQSMWRKVRHWTWDRGGSTMQHDPHALHLSSNSVFNTFLVLFYNKDALLFLYSILNLNLDFPNIVTELNKKDISYSSEKSKVSIHNSTRQQDPHALPHPGGTPVWKSHLPSTNGLGWKPATCLGVWIPTHNKLKAPLNTFARLLSI